jgi:putative ABC transport system permease protein
VIGTLAERSTGAQVGGQDPNDTVIMPLKTVQRRFTGNDNLQFFVIKYSGAYSSASVQAALIDLLRERRLLQPGQDLDFDIIDTAQVNDVISSATGALTAMVAAIAGISLLVGGIGIMNIMLVSVTERTREIGIRLAIGALSREVQLQFLTEAVVLCCFGGLVGIGFALLLSAGLATLLDVPFVFDPTVNLLSFLFSAVLGILFGFYPARRASKLDPIEALRHE